ncbi:MAG: pilus assembly protein [Actinomycetota bacterium]|nr:pilus assembly protein [Actinomycetota bacterium]
MVEFAFVGPVLMVLLFGVIEFSWVFNQFLDVRHGSREAARLVAVNYQPGTAVGDAQTTSIVTEICGRIDAPEDARVQISLVTAGVNEPGDLAVVRVERDLEQLTGFFAAFLNNLQPNAETTFLLEQDATWNATVGEVACP